MPVLDADSLAHEMLEPGQAAYEEMVREFGAGILDADGKMDRAKLGGDRLCRSRRSARGSTESCIRAILEGADNGS